MTSSVSVFHDQSGRRRRRFRWATIAFVLLLILSTVAFAATIMAVRPQAALPFAVEHPTAASSPARNDFLHRSRRSLRRTASAFTRLWGGTRDDPNRPLAIAFHAPWDKASQASLQRHIEELDWLIPGWVSITGPNHKVTTFPDAQGRATLAHAIHRPVLLPMIQNAIEGNWDGAGMAALLRDPKARKHTLDQVEAMVAANAAQGVFFDFEELPAAAHPYYRQFLAEAHARFAPHGWIVAIAVPADDEEWNLAAYARVTDKLFLMAYDEHYQGGDPGPIASQRWFEGVVTNAKRVVPPAKLVVAVASYAYDWTVGTSESSPDTIEEAWLAARDSDAVPIFDRASGESHFDYDEDDAHHQVWLADAVSFRNNMVALHAMGVRSIALWRMGSEDPSLWNFFGRDNPTLPAASVLRSIPPGNDVDIEGAGEILRIGATPVTGERGITTDARGQYIVDSRFLRLPSPFVVQRVGYKPKLVALTFDDGPDPDWTPQVLDVLKAKGVPATFFIVGENALTQRGLLQRELADGHEVGSHTYTHPNLARTTQGETSLELNANQRLFQAFTGHSMRLFRAPYFGDAEPTTADEIVPVAQAQRMGYLSVGLHVDPGDWRRPGVQAIVDETIADIVDGPPSCPSDAAESCSRNIVLLHDSGGDRTQTIAALPLLIDALRARGYRFVTVSALAGLTAQAVNPPIAASDLTAARADLALFLTLGWITIALKWLFTIAIGIGIARAVILSALALMQARREARTVFPAIDPATRVTVLIPAFNEERVIERAVAQVLASRDVGVRVIVIDDGSKDRTGAVVQAAFGGEARVQLLTLANGGKARALNTALALVEDEVVIALDADTQFEPTTVARLARWFVDERLGAVAGNAKVGNRVNLVTRWQALEYITAQNLERRAFARVDAMTVVPGAVGAWRTAALRAVGGYPEDTLAEDQDLTIAIQRAGWRVRYDQYAVAWTEAPEGLRGLAKQRFRWAFGTLQCLWKHRGALIQGRPRGLAWIGLPQAFLFQIVMASISPVIDLALIVGLFATWLRVEEHGWAQTSGDVYTMLIFWLVFTAIDLLSAVIAFALERRESWRLLWLLVPQRVGYRQVMYYVVVKAIVQAIRGPSVGWGKLERSGRVATR